MYGQLGKKDILRLIDWEGERHYVWPTGREEIDYVRAIRRERERKKNVWLIGREKNRLGDREKKSVWSIGD